MVAAVGRRDWCLLVAAACKGVTGAVGACELSGSWGRKWQLECIEGRQCPK